MSIVDSEVQRCLCDRRVYDVQVLGDDRSPGLVSYVVRGLNNDEEVTTWTMFCEQAFAYKKPSPPKNDYFARHYFNDPSKHPSHVRIAVLNRELDHPTQGICLQDIVSSCRIFYRTISIIGITSLEENFATATAGGIGEVCTHESHRYRGLAKELLKDALECMSAMQLNVSMLHSAPSFFPVYQKVGFVNVTSHWSVITINHSKLLSSQQNAFCPPSSHDTPLIRQSSLRLASFPSDTFQLIKLHQFYSEKRFLGCIVRSSDYWNNYISAELGDKFWILEELSGTPQASNVENPISGNILGWMVLRYRVQQQRYQLCDFGCCDIQAAPCIFQKLLVHCHKTMELSRAPQNCMDDSDKRGCWTLCLPTPVLGEVRGDGMENASYIADIVSENDSGWMYKSLAEKGFDMASLARRQEHLIWPSDSF